MKIVNMQPDLSALLAYVNDHHEPDECRALEVFVEKYFESVTYHEYIEKTLEETYGFTLSSWHFLIKAHDSPINTRVFNPDQIEGGWHSTHTVIQVHSPDMPFLMDTVRMEINRRQMAVHSVQAATMRVVRDEQGVLSKAEFEQQNSDQGRSETLLYLEIDKHSDEAVLQDIQNKLQDVLLELAACVEDFPRFLSALDHVSAELNALPCEKAEDDVAECLAFLSWLAKEHFTFLAYDEFSITEEGDVAYVVRDKTKNLGIFRYRATDANKKKIIELPPEIQEFMLSDTMINFFKSGVKSRIHRPAYSDYVVIKKFNEKGEVIGGFRFMGLYTSTVYLEPPSQFPIIRKKVQQVWDMANLHPTCYSGKELTRILEIFPRDELIQSTTEQLFNTTIGILSMKERMQTRIFIRRDTYGKFLACLCYTPRESFNTELRLKIQNVLCDIWRAKEAQFYVYFSESVLARIHFILRLDDSSPQDVNIPWLEKKIQQVARSWSDDLSDACLDEFGEEKGNATFFKYRNAFPVAYRADFDAADAVCDLKTIECLSESPEQDIRMSVSRDESESSDDKLNFKLFTTRGLLPLSDLLPVLENFGLRVIGEHPYKIRLAGDKKVFIHSFSIVYTFSERVDMLAVKLLFQQAFRKIWDGDAENDSFNKLVLGAGIDWRDIAMFRAYARYMKQTLFGISEQYIADTLIRYVSICKLLLQAFKSRFGIYPDWSEKHRTSVFREVEREFLSSLDNVEQLNEDRVLRCYLELISATLRTNFFQRDENNNLKPYLSFKLSPRQISHVPEPVPMFEIFVYSSRVEGVHLRGGKVARGGIRWSDRNEDFRTEVLGLVKAQQVKNAVIIPVGAKGGFVAKNLAGLTTREEIQQEGIESYKTFINALVDVTDNLVDGDVIPPDAVVRHDEDDIYLVVAADKGTATFSDISNAIAIERHFWLGDAFASGGSIGYDHKKMGITAKGAWVSVQRHFREKGLNTQEDTFTVVGIGDMSGDVFGNGMLLSEQIQLVAAFNHLHIFIDPSPDTALSFNERKRLFDLPRSSWADYDQNLISRGGGVFSRSAKSITITDEMRSCFHISAKQLTPTELISALLASPVDLIWNGGIGTYIKSSSETHAEVGDKANDSLRINATDVRAKVIGEGGNLGLTQLARVELTLNGGCCYTDFIDNSGGVDCSDHEVNIKILLNDLVNQGKLSNEERNALFLEMTDEVGDLVLRNNYYQTQAISYASLEADDLIEDHLSVIDYYVEQGKLNRELEFLPSSEVVRERMLDGKVGLAKPELSVLISYVKSDLKEALNCDEIISDPYLLKFALKAFPRKLIDNYDQQIQEHKLIRELIATNLANDMVNYMGAVFVSRIKQSQSGVRLAAIVKAYVVAREIFDLEAMLDEICSLDYIIPSQMKVQMMYFMIRLIRRSCRWLLLNRRGNRDITDEVAFFKEGVDTIKTNLSVFLKGNAKAMMSMRYEEYTAQGVGEELANFIASSSIMTASLGIVEVAHQTDCDIGVVSEAYFSLSEALSLDWIAEQVNHLPTKSHWQELARMTYRSDVERILRSLTLSLLTQVGKPTDSVMDKIALWLDQNHYSYEKWLNLLDKIKLYDQLEYSMFSVALNELGKMATEQDA